MNNNDVGALKQFAQINLFIDYNRFPISVFILALIIAVSSISVILKTNKGKK